MEETVTTHETRTTETVTTITMTTVTQITENEEVPEVRLVDEQHITTMDVAPNFTRPLLPSMEVTEGGTVRSVDVLYI